MAGLLLLKSLIRASSKCKVATVGKIVDIKVSNFGKDGDLYTPVLEYYVNGQMLRGESAGMSGSNSSSKYHVGESMEIKYNSDNPEEFVIAGQSNKGGIILSSVVLGIGVLMLILGVVLGGKM